MEKRPKHARSRSFTGGAIVSFFKSTAASFSATTTTSSAVPVHGRSSFNHRNAFSGPIVSIVPPEARRGGRKGSRGENRSGYRTPEPSSPKVSCIGQIKKAKANKVKVCCKNGACPLPPKPPADQGRIRPKSSLVKRMLFRRSRSRSSSSSSSSSRDSFFKSTAVAAAPAAPAPAGLGQMKRFTSGRAAFEDFDWREAERTAPIDYDDDDEVLVAHSAPLVLGGGLVASEPRKEVNLWSRRPVAPPTPLRLTRK